MKEVFVLNIKLKENQGKNWIGVVPLFSPEQGKTIISPPGEGPGYWAGAPSIFYDNGIFYLNYRLRKPRGEGRGYESRLAKSENGINFETIWSVKREELNTESIERATLIKGIDEKYRLYISFVDPEDQKWRIDLIEAEEVKDLDVSKRKKVFTPSCIGAEGVKDPYVLIVGRKYYMFISYAPTLNNISSEIREKMHSTSDVYNTGITKSCTGLATSLDGKKFRWIGDILSPGNTGWDKYCRRITTIIYNSPVFTAIYDGIPSVEDNYEEKTGIATSFDLVNFEPVTVDEPILISPNSSGSLRYIDAVNFEREIWYYYEYARADGSHELRFNKVKL